MGAYLHQYHLTMQSRSQGCSKLAINKRGGYVRTLTHSHLQEDLLLAQLSIRLATS